MIDINEIASKIAEEKNNFMAKAFTMQIGVLLRNNGIVPIVTEYTKQDIDNITDANEYKLVHEYGVAFNELDTSEHDAKVKADAFEEFVRLYKVFQDIPCNKDVFPVSCDGMCIDCFEKWVKEQKNE